MIVEESDSRGKGRVEERYELSILENQGFLSTVLSVISAKELGFVNTDLDSFPLEFQLPMH